MIKGWCPGVLRPMETGDGWLVRLRIGGGILALEKASRIAEWSRRWGNGCIDLTSRGNLQLRGVAVENLPALQAAMAAQGLLDANPEGEAVRNVVSPPLSGIDPDAVLDARPLAEALERRLSADSALHALPGKFSISIDDGGSLSLAGVAADIRFVALAGAHGPEVAVRLAGDSTAAGWCGPEELVPVAVALCRVFLAERRGREGDVRRMADLVAERGAAAIALAAGLAARPLVRASFDGPAEPGHDGRETAPAVPARPGDDDAPAVPRCRADHRHGGAGPGHGGTPAVPAVFEAGHGHPARGGSGEAKLVILGLDPRIAARPRLAHDPIAQKTGRSVTVVGAGVAFGAMTADGLDLLASAATAAGGRELRLTPWRTVLLPVPAATARHALAALSGGGFILDARDRRRRVAACSGAPACARATTPVREDAMLLSSTPRGGGGGIVLHVSGCEKGCAHPGVAPLTLVARLGRYDLVRDGTAAGTPVRRGLTLEQAADEIARISAARMPQAAA